MQDELPIVVLVVDNGMYGTIRMHQERRYPGRVIGTDLATPTSSPTREAFGCHGERRRAHRGRRAGAFDEALGVRAPGAARAARRSRGDHAARRPLDAIREAPRLRSPTRSPPGAATAVEAVEEALRAHRRAARPRAVITLCGDEALARAGRACSGRLAGVPLLVKDLIDTAGVRTTYGVVDLRRARARSHGAGGRSARGGGRDRRRARPTPTSSPGAVRPERLLRRPRQPARLRTASPGARASGNAAALAAGLVPLALGTDTGGSVRMPGRALRRRRAEDLDSARFPTDGVFPLVPSFDTVGPMARTVADCALAYVRAHRARRCPSRGCAACASGSLTRCPTSRRRACRGAARRAARSPTRSACGRSAPSVAGDRAAHAGGRHVAGVQRRGGAVARGDVPQPPRTSTARRSARSSTARCR